MSCPDHPQWYHDRDDCPFCAVTQIRAEQQRRQTVLGATEPDWHSVALRIGEELASVGPTGYYDLTPAEWFVWTLRQIVALRTNNETLQGEAIEKLRIEMTTLRDQIAALSDKTPRP